MIPRREKVERLFPRPINCSSLIAVFSRWVSSRQTRRQQNYHALASENLDAPGNFIAPLFPNRSRKTDISVFLKKAPRILLESAGSSNVSANSLSYSQILQIGNQYERDVQTSGETIENVP